MIDAWDLFSSFRILIFPTWLITNSWARASASATLAMNGWIRKRLGLFFIQYVYFLDVNVAVDGKYTVLGVAFHSLDNGIRLCTLTFLNQTGTEYQQ